jgi:hypothetical protein
MHRVGRKSTAMCRVKNRIWLKWSWKPVRKAINTHDPILL